jgi:hypothetical protein
VLNFIRSPPDIAAAVARFLPNLATSRANIAELEVNIANLASGPAKFDPELATSDSNIARFGLNVAKLDAGVAAFRAKVANFGENLANVGAATLRIAMELAVFMGGGENGSSGGVDGRCGGGDCDMGHHFYMGSDAELLSSSAHFARQISATPTAYGLTAAQAAAYGAANDAYAAAYKAAIDPETRTRGKVAGKNAAREVLVAIASSLVKIIDATASDEQKIDLGVNVRKTPAPIAAPSVQPGVGVVSVVGRTVTIRISNPSSATRRGKPAGVIGALVHTFVGEEYPADPKMWQFQGATTQSRLPIEFPNHLPAGTQVWVRAEWLTRRCKTSPASTPITTNLQGGGSSVEREIRVAA